MEIVSAPRENGTVAAIANEKGLQVFHLDVSQAFVQVPLEEKNYMRLPPSCGELSGKVLKLLERPCGLKQGGREWKFLLVTWLVDKIGMEQCIAEPCVFRKIAKNEVSLMFGVYVDNIMVSGGRGMCDECFARLSVTGRTESSRWTRRHSRKIGWNSTSFSQPRTF